MYTPFPRVFKNLVAQAHEWETCSLSVVCKLLKHIMEKLQANDRTQAVSIGIRRGIIQL
jgi:hypothetical protein